MASEGEKKWAAGAHLVPAVASVLSMGLLGWIVSPLIFFTKGRQSRFVGMHCLQSMIFQLLLGLAAGIVVFGLGLIPFVGGLLGVVVGLVALLVGIGVPVLGAMRANQGREYAIPVAAQIAKALKG